MIDRFIVDHVPPGYLTFSKRVRPMWIPAATVEQGPRTPLLVYRRIHMYKIHRKEDSLEQHMHFRTFLGLTGTTSLATRIALSFLLALHLGFCVYLLKHPHLLIVLSYPLRTSTLDDLAGGLAWAFFTFLKYYLPLGFDRTSMAFISCFRDEVGWSSYFLIDRTRCEAASNSTFGECVPQPRPLDEIELMVTTRNKFRPSGPHTFLDLSLQIFTGRTRLVETSGQFRPLPQKERSTSFRSSLPLSF